jgi:hypothetical protein
MKAVIVINGMEYFEWESVYVRVEWYGRPPRHTRFTASEQTPWAKDWAFLRIRPGDKCEIYLDTCLVITGLVCTRQVYYDGTQHSVTTAMIFSTAAASSSSVGYLVTAPSKKDERGGSSTLSSEGHDLGDVGQHEAAVLGGIVEHGHADVLALLSVLARACCRSPTLMVLSPAKRSIRSKVVPSTSTG